MSELTLTFENTATCAAQLDEQDALKGFRDEYYVPVINGKDSIYFNGNSLGLQPKATQEYVLDEMEDWASFGGEGHFHARNPWVKYNELFPESIGKIVGALPHEVIVMNNLTVNLHLMLTTFYRPTKEKFKIICEAKAFPSDQYVFQSQVKNHGFSIEEAIIEVHPRAGEYDLRQEDIEAIIDTHKNELCLVLFGGINYYTGQVFNMKAITDAAHAAGAYCGFDLAHAVGNVPLSMHDWNVDFACWCTYKYLNSSPGGVAGAYIHEQFVTDKTLPRLAGWWGQDKATRFKMEKEFDPIPTAEGWQLSNGPILLMAAHKAALDLFDAAGMENLFQKAQQLSNYMMFIVDDINAGLPNKRIEIITPRDEMQKGCQTSLLIPENGRAIFDGLRNAGVIADWREPNVIRVAPTPMYNSFTDIYNFGVILKQLVSSV